jgi:hypothetical protein
MKIKYFTNHLKRQRKRNNLKNLERLKIYILTERKNVVLPRINDIYLKNFIFLDLG